MPFYRLGDPGEDSWAHVNFGRKAGPSQCRAPRFPEDNPDLGENCGRMSVALCDAVIVESRGFGKTVTCDVPMCQLHRTPHTTKKNTDYCPKHKELANA